MKAVILCAGQGLRLRPHTESVPKALVPVLGVPILQYQFDAVRPFVDEVILVTGYLHDHIARFAEGQAAIVRNESYASTNSLFSFWLASDLVAGTPFALLNGDLIIDRDLVGQFIDHPAPTACLVDDTYRRVAGEMNVSVRDGRIVEFSKEIPPERADAQSLQVTKFGAADATLLAERAGELIAQGETGRFTAFAYDRILAESAMVPVYRRGGRWFEVDTLEDLEHCQAALREGAPA